MKIKDIIFQIKDINFTQALEYLVEEAEKKGEKTFVVTINPEIIMLARGDTEYEKVIKSADLAVNDGVGVTWAGKMFGKSFKGRIHGVDLVEKLCKAVAKKPITVGFLGGYQNVAQVTSERLREKYPGLKVAFAISEDSDPTQRIRKSESQTIRGSENPNFRQADLPSFPKTDILFVAFGSPKQEKWIYDRLPSLNTRVAIGVGGAFDFISGKVKRAPIWIRNLGFEWLFRLVIQPWRIKRQLALPKFVILVLKERFLA